MLEITIFIAVILGGALKIALPFLIKKQEAGGELKFESKYIFTAIMGLIGSLVSAGAIFPSILNTSQAAVESGQTVFVAFWIAFWYALGIQQGVSMFADRLGKGTTTTVVDGDTDTTTTTTVVNP